MRQNINYFYIFFYTAVMCIHRIKSEKSSKMFFSDFRSDKVRFDAPLHALFAPANNGYENGEQSDAFDTWMIFKFNIRNVQRYSKYPNTF